MKMLDFDGYTMDPTAVNFVGDVSFSRSGESLGTYSFQLIINGSSVKVGHCDKKDAADKKREEFIKVWKDAVGGNL